MKKTIALVTYITALAFGASAGEIWVSPVGTDNTGAGTMASPYVRSSATSFDTLMNDGAVVTDNTVVHLLAGTFRTRANNAYPSGGWNEKVGFVVKPGMKVHGAGIDATIIKIDNGIVSDDNAENGINRWVFLPDTNRLAHGSEITDLTIDCNLQNQSSGRFSAGRLSGSNTRLSRIKAINWGCTLTGTTSPYAECFVLGIAYDCFYHSKPGQGNQLLTNCIIEEIEITQPAPVTHTDGATAIFMWGAPSLSGDSCWDYPSTSQGAATPGPGWVRGGEIRNCRIMNVHSGAPNHPLFFQGINPGYGTETMRVHGNHVIDVIGNAIYDEEAYFRNLAIENNFLVDVSYGYQLYSDKNVSNLLRENLLIRGNYIVLRTDVLSEVT